MRAVRRAADAQKRVPTTNSLHLNASLLPWSYDQEQDSLNVQRFSIQMVDAGCTVLRHTNGERELPRSNLILLVTCLEQRGMPTPDDTAVTHQGIRKPGIRRHTLPEGRMSTMQLQNLVNLEGKQGLVVGVSNARSIAYGCARVFHACGAELALTYGHPRSAEFVRPLAEELECSIVAPCNVEYSEQIDALFAQIGAQWGRLDFLLHAIAFVPREDLCNQVLNCSPEGFARAMHISCYSFIHMARLAVPLMRDGGCLLTVSHYGAEKFIEHYNIMGPIKAALESVVRYLTVELGSTGIRAHVLSPGPLSTRSGNGIAHFDDVIRSAVERAPQHHGVSTEDIGAMAAFLVSDAARWVTGNTAYVDAGYHVMG
jgi:enoyl-[acyl-carrier protein] reductase I